MLSPHAEQMDGGKSLSFSFWQQLVRMELFFQHRGRWGGIQLHEQTGRSGSLGYGSAPPHHQTVLSEGELVPQTRREGPRIA